MAAKQKGKRAWVITCEQIGDHAKPDRRFVAAFSSRRSPEWIKQFVQIIHDVATLDPTEILYYMNRQRKVPYKTQDFHYKESRVMDKFTCGHNPYVFGRLVNSRARMPVFRNIRARFVFEASEIPILT